LGLSEEILKRFKPSDEDLLIDIGSNTGTLLSMLKAKNLNVLGVDPSEKHAKIAIKSGIPTVIDYFSEKCAKEIALKHGQARIMLCNNTFDHVYDLDKFMKGVTTLLKRNGIFIFEVPYFKNMLENLTHIPYHQQLDYIILTPLIAFFERYGMEIVDAELGTPK
ncbi:methyltransferase domain-containing protein, partial [Candidatus Saccharibacteria bacterium]|nr:methyltransferase domain-containing protein [Candidatus Saccharibacteria bacterium]